MKTSEYNPSQLEVMLAEVLCDLKEDINKKLESFKIYRAGYDISIDNPTVTFYLEDDDKDRHEVVIRIIQKPDDNL